MFRVSLFASNISLQISRASESLYLSRCFVPYYVPRPSPIPPSLSSWLVKSQKVTREQPARIGNSTRLRIQRTHTYTERQRENERRNETKGSVILLLRQWGRVADVTRPILSLSAPLSRLLLPTLNISLA